MKLISKDFLLSALKTLTLAQKDLQTLSLYIISNKTYIFDIIECYLFIYYKSSIFHRLLLYYLGKGMN